MRRLVAILLLVLASIPAAVLTAQETATCTVGAPPQRATVLPSPCVAAGADVRVRVEQFAPSQMVSVILVGAQGKLTGSDRAMRLNGAELVISNGRYFGNELTAGSYRVYVKDVGGHAPPARADFIVGAAAAPTATPPPTAGGNCDPSYPTVCIPPAPPDLNCEDIPHRDFEVLPPDPHGFDGNDNDGIGCELP